LKFRRANGNFTAPLQVPLNVCSPIKPGPI
jgi:hypothetical protein